MRQLRHDLEDIHIVVWSALGQNSNMSITMSQAACSDLDIQFIASWRHVDDRYANLTLQQSRAARTDVESFDIRCGK